MDYNLSNYCTKLIKIDIDSNKNRYYEMKIIKDNDKYIVNKNFKRIGFCNGRSNKKLFTNLDDAIKFFKDEFKRKTFNIWDTEFIDKGGYVKLKTEIEIKSLKSNICPKVKKLLDFISQKIIFEKEELEYFMISDDNINKAENILTKIRNSDDDTRSKLSKQYYQIVPQKITSRKKLGSIQDNQIPNEFLKLRDIENFKNKYQDYNGQNPYDILVDQIGKKITSIKKSDKVFTCFKTCINTSFCKNHKFKLTLDSIYEINDNNKIDKSKKCKLLFHGSGLDNWLSILKKGLVLNPEKEGAKITGKMFGNGVYFANIPSKSAQYCLDKSKHNEKICMLVARVDTGREYKTLKADPLIKKKDIDKYGYNSIKGIGQMMPFNEKEFNGDIIYSGKIIKSNYNSVLKYDEYIVYDTRQIEFKYLLLLNKINIQK